MSTPAEAEATRDTVEFEHFDRTWTVPSQQRYTHMRKLRDAFRQEASIDLAIIDTFLDAEQLGRLAEVDPTEPEVGEFADAIAKAVGFKDAGNS